MFERFTEAARSVVVQAQEQARRFGHGYIGSEHLLLAAAAGSEPASAALRECGITPEALQREISRRAGAGGGAGARAGAGEGAGGGEDAGAGEGARLLGDLDREALASIGIDLDMVEARLEEAFGPGALTRDLGGRQRRPQAASHGAVRRRLARVLRRRRGQPEPAGDLCGRPGAMGHLPFTTTAKKSLARSLMEAKRLGDNYIGMQHVALGLAGMSDGAVPTLLAALGVSPTAVRMAVLNRYRKAG